MDLYMIILRLIHIFFGVFWAGTTFFFVSFLQPTVKAAGPEGGKVMQRLAQSRFATVMPLAAGLTVVAGALMYWRVSGGLQVGWITSGTGLSLTIGAVGGILAFVIGLVVSRPAIVRVAELAKEMQAAGGPPTPAQMAEIQSLQKTLSSGAIWTAVLVAIALLGMAVARYV